MFFISVKFPSMIKMHLQTLFIAIIVAVAYAQDRKIISKLNPGCENCNANTTLVYVRCDGSMDTIHQIWDFTQHVPTIIFAVGSLNSSITVNWDGTTPKSFFISENPTYSFAAAIDKLYEYNDLDDNGHIDPKLPQKQYNLDRLSWYLNESTLTDKEAMIHVYGVVRENRHGKHGTIRIKLDLLPFKDYAVDLPHLIHTANSTLVDVSLVNLSTSREYNASRYALHLLLVSTDSPTDTMHTIMRKSLDDEHTPGVFEIMEIKTPALYSTGEGGYLQFRPVGYTQPERGVASSTIAHVSDFNRTSLTEHSTLRQFYAAAGLSPARLLLQAVLVSFGEAGDGCYARHNYTAWSFTIGYGAPPAETFSLFVIMVISIGLGVPVLLAVSGVAYALLRRRRCARARARSRLAEEE